MLEKTAGANLKYVLTSKYIKFSVANQRTIKREFCDDSTYPPLPLLGYVMGYISHKVTFRWFDLENLIQKLSGTILVFIRKLKLSICQPFTFVYHFSNFQQSRRLCSDVLSSMFNQILNGSPLPPHKKGGNYACLLLKALAKARRALANGLEACVRQTLFLTL